MAQLISIALKALMAQLFPQPLMSAQLTSTVHVSTAQLISTVRRR
jgi:hypothetical protein